jgi:hypothetical protein
MRIVLRPGRPSDASVCGPICFDAFKAINDEHNFPPDFPSAEAATGRLAMLLSHPGSYSVVAEQDGKILGRATFSTSAVRLSALGRSPSIRGRRTQTSGAR